VEVVPLVAVVVDAAETVFGEVERPVASQAPSAAADAMGCPEDLGH
jgi:hypothetical protein